MKKNSPGPSLKKRRVKRKKVLIALSGGIDSAVSAYLLLKQGYEVEAAFMKNWSSTAGLKYSECPWLEDRQDALRVAAFLRIPLHTLDFEKQYGEKVMKYFFREYAAGRTPNPDVMCNKEIKFKLLYNWAMKNGFDYLATGHYARVKQVASRKVASSKSGYQLPATSYQLIRSADEFKDQTYFIYNIKPEQLPHLLFPIGGMKKTAVRSLARKIDLPNAEKKESMGLCFVGRVRLKDFLEQKLKPKEGPIVLVSSRPTTSASEEESRDPVQSPVLDSGHFAMKALKRNSGMTERIIGKHQGLHIYTIGQRQGIAVGAGGPYFVVKKDLKRNRLYVTNNPDDPALMTREAQIHSVNWTNPGYSLLATSYKLVGRYRHQGELAPLIIARIDKNHYSIKFQKPQKAVASGQSLVLYKGKECVGGGVIG